MTKPSDSEVLRALYVWMEADRACVEAEDEFFEMSRTGDWTIERSTGAFEDLEIRSLQEKAQIARRKLRKVINAVDKCHTECDDCDCWQRNLLSEID